MRAPDSFVETLHSEFNGRLRVRWSYKRNEFHIEQHVGRAALPPVRISEADDDMIRARDGFAFVLSIRPGDRMPCPDCGRTLKVPVFACGEVTCASCRSQGRDARYVAGFFPLGDRLISYLRSIDPERRDMRELIAKLDEHNARLEASRTRAASTQIEAATLEHFNRLVGIQQVGYTGKENI